MLYIKKQEMQRVMQQALENVGCDAARAQRLARIITENTMDGSTTHGANRFPRLVAEVASGIVSLEGEMTKVSGFGGLEVWDGGFGFGVLNAEAASERAIALAKEHGIGCVSLRNSNHWMRPGRYGWNMAKAGMIGICWSNTGMVGTGDPQRIEALHALKADQRILQGCVHGMTHMQLTGNIGGRHYNGKGLLVGMLFRMEKAATLPHAINSVFDLLRFIHLR